MGVAQTDAGLLYLRDLKELDRLNLQGSQFIGDRGRKALRAVRPKLLFEW
jgi:hypothetical protein